jgi:endonuclease-8
VASVPEGDTIHRIAARLRPLLEGRVPQEILTPHPRHALDRWSERLAGRAVRTVDVYGKHLFLRFEGELTLHSHLRMSGAWAVYERSERWRRSASRAWIVLGVGERRAVQFDGPVLELRSDYRVRHDPRLVALGPDVLGDRLDERELLRRARAGDGRRAIGEVLLDQRVLAGIGNVWKAEACFAAALDPWRRLQEISDSQLLELVAFARERMRVCVSEGPAARPRAVYRRAGMPCVRCGGRIRVRGQGADARATFWCPACQR